MRLYLGIGDVVDKYATIRTAIKCSTETLKSFLTGSVPKLALHPLTVDANILDFEVDPDSGHVATAIIVFSEANQQISLSD